MRELNVDPVEIEKFQSIASRWWDPESEFKPLHDINPLRVGYIESRSGTLGDKKILDIGCGGGILTEALALKGANVTGIDMAEKSLKVAKMHLQPCTWGFSHAHRPIFLYTRWYFWCCTRVAGWGSEGGNGGQR